MTYAGSLDTLSLGERAFEIALARKIAAGEEKSAWFERHGSTLITELPVAWPADYRDLVQRRLEVIESEPFINLLERPENKRRWASVPLGRPAVGGVAFGDLGPAGGPGALAGRTGCGDALGCATN